MEQCIVGYSNNTYSIMHILMKTKFQNLCVDVNNSNSEFQNFFTSANFENSVYVTARLYSFFLTPVVKNYSI